MKSLLLAFVFCGVLTVLPANGAEPPDNSLYQLKSPWTDQEGRTAPLARFQGTPVLIAMIYSHCRDMCPLTIESMKKIELDWQKRSSHPFHLVLVSLDSERDKPTVLKEFAKSLDLDQEHWSLLSGKASDIRKLAALLGVNYRAMGDGEFSHSNLIALLDSQGRLIFSQADVAGDLNPFYSALKAKEAEF